MFIIKKLELDEANTQNRCKMLVGIDTFPIASNTSLLVLRKTFDIQHQVTFNFGNGENSRSIEYIIGKMYDSFPIPTVFLQNQKIVNWYATSDFSGNPVRKTDLVDGNITNLYAKWGDIFGEEYAEFSVSIASANTTISIAGVYSETGSETMYINWGDGTQPSVFEEDQSNVSHQYATPGTYTIKFSDTVVEVDISTSSSTVNTWLTGVLKWGNIYYINSYGFANCVGLTSINLPDNLQGGTYIFQQSGLTSITIPDSVSKAITGWFRNCTSLATAVVGSGVTAIVRAFMGCSNLTSVTFRGTNITQLGSYSFSGCSRLASISIPDSVKTTGTYAFQNCSSLTSLTFPAMTSIAANTFNGASACLVFDFSNCTSVPTLANVSAFANTNANKKIVVPDNLYSSWIAANNWKSSTNNIKNSIISRTDYLNS